MNKSFFHFTFIAGLVLIFNPFASHVLAQKNEQAADHSEASNRHLKIPVWVESEGGELWVDASAGDFKVSLDDEEAEVKGVQGPQSPTVLLVVFDTVADPARVDEARAALKEELKKLGDQYWVGLLRAQNGLTVLQEPTADRALLAEKIDAVPVSGKAGLLDTLEPVSHLAAAITQKADVRISVLYITDGGINNYRADYLNPVINSSDRGDLSRRFSDRAVQERVSSLSDSLRGSSVPLFVLHLNYRDDVLNIAYQGGLEKITSLAGGESVFCRTSDDIPASLATIFGRIRSTYVLTVKRPMIKRETLKVNVEVQEVGDHNNGREIKRVKSLSQIKVNQN